MEAASQDASRSIADAFGNRADELVNTIENARNSAENLANMSDALADSLNSSIDGSYSGASAVGALDSIADADNGVAEAARNKKTQKYFELVPKYLRKSQAEREYEERGNRNDSNRL